MIGGIMRAWPANGHSDVRGYKEALSVSVFHTMGRICCMDDTMGLGKFFTSAVTAWDRKQDSVTSRTLAPRQGFPPCYTHERRGSVM